MNPARLALLFLFGLGSLGANAASFVPGELDCAQILQRWAENPASVPKHLVDACKEKMAEAAPLPPPAPMAALPAPRDPCSGPDAASSVLCWGPWAALAPAAAPTPASLNFPEFPGDCEYGSELAEQCVALLAEPGPEPPIEGCTPGTPCGFATNVEGVTSHDDVEQTEFARFDLATDGTAFTVNPGEDGEIGSVPLDPTFQARPDDYENMRSNGSLGDEQSRLVARVIRGENGQIELAADVWTDGNRVTGAARSGFFAWGTATSQSGLELLNGNGVSVSFAGPMSVDNATNAAMTVNFGSQPTWTGTWTNPGWSFGAGGTVTGVNMISSPGQFTPNVQAGSFVQGALLGEPGRQGIAHIIDVTLETQGRIKDVGLLREVLPGTGPQVGP